MAFRSQWTAISSLLSCIHILVDVLNEPAGARLPPTLSPGYAPGPFLLTARASIAMTTLELPAKSVLCTPGKANGNPLQNFRCYVIGIQDRNYSVVGREPVLTVQRNTQPGVSGPADRVVLNRHEGADHPLQRSSPRSERCIRRRCSRPHGQVFDPLRPYAAERIYRLQ